MPIEEDKDENEMFKKEGARVTSTFYKSIQTTNNNLEQQIEVLKKQLGEANSTWNRLEEKKENSVRRLALPD